MPLVTPNEVSLRPGETAELAGPSESGSGEDLRQSAKVSLRRLSAENERLRAEVEKLRTDRETLKQTVEIMVEMTDFSGALA